MFESHTLYLDKTPVEALGIEATQIGLILEKREYSVMPNILKYSRNRSTSVEQIDDQSMRSTCRLQDTLTDTFVEIMVKLPDLEITSARAEVYRTYQEECRGPEVLFPKMVGVRIGPGVLKIIKGLVGETTECKQLAFMVEECCHGVILSFTKDVLLSSPRPEDEAEAKEFYGNMVRENIRLYNRCAAFAPGSSLVEGIEPPT